MTVVIVRLFGGWSALPAGVVLTQGPAWETISRGDERPRPGRRASTPVSRVRRYAVVVQRRAQTEFIRTTTSVKLRENDDDDVGLASVLQCDVIFFTDS